MDRHRSLRQRTRRVDAGAVQSGHRPHARKPTARVPSIAKWCHASIDLRRRSRRLPGESAPKGFPHGACGALIRPSADPSLILRLSAALHSIPSSARKTKGIIPFRRLRGCSTCVIVVRHPQWTYDMASDEEVGRQILRIFMQHKVGASGVLRRNYFIDVRDADFQRGLNKAVENRWIKIKSRDRYTYELTEAGLAAGLGAGLPPKPLG
jgi:hypothetical protein